MLSPNWYRVAALKPRLRAGVRIVRHKVRGESWVVLTDPVSGRHHRFDPQAWALLAGCNGERTLDEVWARRAQDDLAPTQEQALNVVAQAFAANLLLGDVPPEAGAVMRSRQRDRARQRKAAINPLAFRVPLWDPDAFLTRHGAACAGLFSRRAFIALLLLLATALPVLAVRGADFTQHAAQLAGSTRFWLIVWLVYPLLKALHEMAHAFAVKRYGGEVHAIGVTLLLLTPVPYVDATAAAAFANKHQRAVVAAAGIAVELAVAAVGLLLWALLEGGLARDIAAALVLIGGTSTLLVNGNPLLRFDGYHVATDLLELPNLGSRSALWWRLLLKRALGARAARLPHVAPGEQPWLVGYAPASWLMQALLVGAAVTVLAPWNALVAAVLALVTLWSLLLGPLLRGAAWVVQSAELQGSRARALTATLASAGVLGCALVAVPVPDRSHAPGLVWLPDDAFVRARSDGFVEALPAQDGAPLEAGAVIARLSNHTLAARLQAVAAELERERIESAQQFGSNAAANAQTTDRIQRLVAEHAELQQQIDGLTVRAPRAGRLVLDPQRVRIGQFMPQGELLAQLLPGGQPLVRAFVANDDIARVAAPGTTAHVTLAQGGGGWGARLSATDGGGGSAASRALPSAALGDRAGGSIALDTSDPSGRTAAEPRLQLELRLSEKAPAPIGARVLVTFEHGDSAVLALAAQALRRLFLRRFDS